MNTGAFTDQLEQARATARELVEPLEAGTTPIAQSLAKAQRWARPLRDSRTSIIKIDPRHLS